MASKKSIYKIIKKGTPEELDAFLQENPDKLNADTFWHDEPILYASYRKKLEMVKILIKHDADLNVTDSYGDNALHNACRRDDYAMAQALINAGIDSSHKNKNRRLAEYYTDRKDIKDLVTPHQDKVKQENKKKAAAPEVTGVFMKENEYTVSITEHTPHCDVTEKIGRAHV